MSEKEVIKLLGKTKEESDAYDIAHGRKEGTTFEKAMGVLSEKISQGLKILNCASEALYNWLGGTVKEGVLALQALSIEIATGNFDRNSIKDGQLHTSLAAQQAVLARNGVNAQGYGVGLDEFVNGLGAGEKAVVWVNKNHFMTVLKNKDGTLDLIDPQRNKIGRAHV